MKHLWKVALNEYQRNVFKRSFILLMISVPAFIAFSIGVTVDLEKLQAKKVRIQEHPK